MMIGYMRVPKADVPQTSDLHRDALGGDEGAEPAQALRAADRRRDIHVMAANANRLPFRYENAG